MSVSNQQELTSRWRKVIKRRAFLHGIGGVAAAGAAMPVKTMFADSPKLSKGDAAILQFAAAAESIEADLWQQYNELGGAVTSTDSANPGNPAYVNALEQLDGDMPQYISDNTDDEISHRDFLNAYLKLHGASPVDFTQFETLQGTTAMGATPHKGRLTNLMSLNVDSSWYFRYRSTTNPDFGAQFPQLIDIDNQPAIPLHDGYSTNTIQAIANIASIHFAFIEQGGSSLYPILALKATDSEVLRILLSIGGVEIDHFSLWHDKMGNAFQPPVAPLDDNGTGGTGLNFLDLTVAANQHNAGLSATDKAAGSQMFQPNLILPEPCDFIMPFPALPRCSVIHPTLSQNGGPIATVKAFMADNLFLHQSQMFIEMLMDLASDAEAAQRQGPN